MIKRCTALVAALTLLSTAAAVADEDWDAGIAAYKAKKYRDAAAAFARYVDKVPDAYQGHMMLGNMLLKADDAGKAAGHLRKANELKPGDSGIQLSLGRALLKAGKASDGCAVLGSIKASSLPEANQTALYQMRAGANCGGGSIDDLKKVAEAKNDGVSWAAYGVAALNQAQVSTAVSALDKAVAKSPNDVKIRKSHYSAVATQARTAKGGSKESAYAKLVSTAQKLAQIDNTYDSVLKLAEARIGAKQYSEAARDLDRAISKDGGKWRPYYLKGQALSASSVADYSGALAPLEKALQLGGAGAAKDVNNQLGFVHAKLKNFDQAIAAYNAAGNSAAAANVAENKNIAAENAAADRHNEEIARLEAEKARLEAEMKASTPGAGPPPLR